MNVAATIATFVAASPYLERFTRGRMFGPLLAVALGCGFTIHVIWL